MILFKCSLSDISDGKAAISFLTTSSPEAEFSKLFNDLTNSSHWVKKGKILKAQENLIKIKILYKLQQTEGGSMESFDVSSSFRS